MKIKLGWITVKDLTQAKKFYTNLGLTLILEDKEHGWAEFEGEDTSFTLGIWQEGKALPLPGKAGSNTLLTFYVPNITKAKKELEQQGITFTSEIYTLPSTVKIADFIDIDGNHFQLVEHT